MSNFLAIATVTAALRDVLEGAAKSAVNGAEATTERPDAVQNGDGKARINVFLYQVAPNTVLRNADLPTRRDDGTLSKRPQAALDLHYLMTFFGDEKQQVPQRLVGSTVSALHAQPVLTRETIRKTIQAATESDSNHYLVRSDLAEQVEMVKFTPIPLNLEELSKLWSVFFQTPYSLSVAYQGSVVLIEPDVSPQPALPVRERGLYVAPFLQPVIKEVGSQAGTDEPVVAGDTLIVRGSGLRGADTQVMIGAAAARPDDDDVSDWEIRITLASLPFPADSLRTGIQGVQVVHARVTGASPAPRRESNVAPIVLRPKITVKIAVGDDQPPAMAVEVTLSPSVGRTQRVVLLLNELDPPPDRASRAYAFDAPSRDEEGGPEAVPTVTVPITDVRAGDYLIRVRVDGAESLLEVDDATKAYVGPKVTVP